MQCEIRGMRDVAEASQPTDTLPKPGKVNEVCREWLVKEDGALAYRLQNEEIEQHYTGNKQRNALVREDFPRAREEQRREEETAKQVYQQLLHKQEEYDAQIAKEVAERIEREELERQRALMEEDAELARKIQEKEMKRRAGAPCPLPPPVPNSVPYNPDMNSVGLPIPTEYVLEQQMRSCHLSEENEVYDSDEGYTLPVESSVDSPSPPPISEEEAKRLQEEQDAEFARMLQLQEERRQPLSMIDQDRLIAIEAQDKELARMLQEKERAKARRSRERAKQKALLKKQQQQLSSEDEGFVASPVPRQEEIPSKPAVRPTDLDLSGTRRSISRQKPRYPDPEAIEVLPSVGSEAGPSHILPNIAMAIDPTYSRRTGVYSPQDTPSSSVSSPSISLPVPDFEDEDSPVPPYMPIQGQRRTASLEKKPKKKAAKKEGKDGCKQQ